MAQSGIRASVVFLVVTGCSSASSSSSTSDAGPADSASGAGGSGTFDAALPDAGPAKNSVRQVPGFPDRPYLLHAPPSAAAGASTPVVIVFHGGGGSAEGAPKLTCPGGNESDPGCLNQVAARRGFAVAYPSGTRASMAPSTRTWNAGGGTDNWQCVSGAACARGVDDVAYFDALLVDLKRALSVDSRRVFLTGISNGAALCHRLACERADDIAAIAPIAGENQFQTSGTCVPARGVSILDLHGTADPCWGYDGGAAACAQVDGKDKLSVTASIDGWVARLACNAIPATAALPDLAQDGCSASTASYKGCAQGAEVRLVRIEGGGHTWPGGLLYSRAVGPPCTDFDADELMLDFFEAHPAP
jgi:polyhydroxybutyrate depolymerase